MNSTGTKESGGFVKARKWARQFGVIFIIWTATGLLVVSQWYIVKRGTPHPPALSHILLLELITRWIFALLTPAVLWFSSRFPFGHGRWVRTVAWHTLGALGFQILFVSIRLPLYSITDPVAQEKRIPLWQLYHNMIIEDALYTCMMYATIVAVSQVWEHYRQYRERDLRASRLEAELAQAELKVLKMQMDPHFLFATLKSVAALIHQDVEAADDLVASLSALLRISLDDADEHEVTLKREIDYLNAYLEVQQIRFRNRLAVRVTVDPKSLDALVPNMILPALVENSLWRGFEEGNSSGQVEIRSEVRDGKLRIEIHDDLPRKQNGDEGHLDYSLGLASAQSILQHHYGAAHSFVLGVKAPGGSRLTLEIPLIMRTARPVDQPAVEPLFEEN
jgi:two-component system, LytTR family, sensor kinase